MSMSNLFTAFLTRFPAGASFLYVGVVMAFGITAWTTAADILQRREAVAATAAVLSQLEGRTPAVPRGRGREPDPVNSGSPLLDGATVTVGGANLLQRVAGSITRVGGNILYTQVDLEGPQAKDGFVGVTVSCVVVMILDTVSASPAEGPGLGAKFGSEGPPPAPFTY